MHTQQTQNIDTFLNNSRVIKMQICNSNSDSIKHWKHGQSEQVLSSTAFLETPFQKTQQLRQVNH